MLITYHTKCDAATKKKNEYRVEGRTLVYKFLITYTEIFFDAGFTDFTNDTLSRLAAKKNIILTRIAQIPRIKHLVAWRRKSMGTFVLNVPRFYNYRNFL